MATSTRSTKFWNLWDLFYDQLKSNTEYSDFLAMYDKFSIYTPNDELTQKYGSALNADTLYLHSHRSPLAPIAMEWYKYDYQRLDTLAYRAYSLFFPPIIRH